MVATHVLSTLETADFSNKHAAIFVGIMLAAWFLPTLFVFRLGKYVGGRLLYLGGAMLTTGALFLNADVTDSPALFVWPPIFIGLGLCVLTQSVELLIPCQNSDVYSFLRYAEWSSALIGSLIGGPCTYYMSTVISTKLTLQIMSGIMFVCYMVILRIVQPYNSQKMPDHSEHPRSYNVVFIFALTSMVCGAVVWVPIFCTYLVARISHHAGDEYAIWQLGMACALHNISLAAIVALCDNDTKTASRLVPISAFFVGLCLWGYTLTDAHSHHMWLTAVSSIASAGLRTHIVSWMAFFPVDTHEWSRGVGDFAFGFGSLVGVGSMTLAGTNDRYLRWMTLAAGVAGVLGILLSLQSKETFSFAFTSSRSRSAARSYHLQDNNDNDSQLSLSFSEHRPQRSNGGSSISRASSSSGDRQQTTYISMQPLPRPERDGKADV